MHILIIDDDDAIRNGLNELLCDDHQLVLSKRGDDGLELIKKHVFDVVITDNKMPGLTGLELIRQGIQISPSTSFLLITAFAQVEEAVQAIRDGAVDYLIKPFNLEDIENRLTQISQIRKFKYHENLARSKAIGADRIIGKSPNIAEAREFVSQVANVPSSVLILGPTGAGKEVLAQAIHESGNRKSETFVAINCAAINEQLIESELFGHEKGAFTGADKMSQGKFELANGGTIFLDEIGEISESLQAKLLRVLQEKEFFRVGGKQPIKSNVRVIAATHRDLKKMIDDKKFREDLYFRLNVLSFELKPLSQRKEDIILLAEFFWKILCQEIGRSPILNESILQRLQNYNYPGNIRELKNILERLVVLGPDKAEVPSSTLPIELHDHSSKPSLLNHSSDIQRAQELGLAEYLETIEEEIIKETMRENGHNQVKTAEILKMKRGTLQYKLKKLNI